MGIISVENREYDPKRWWKYSEGVREVIGEGVGYVYARFLFHPEQTNKLIKSVNVTEQLLN